MSMPATPSSRRLAYIDWLRGLACLLMFQTHCYDAWLNGAARRSRFFMWSQLGGSLPAPLFLFLAGISVALVVDKSRERGASPGQVAKATAYRGLQILALGLLFRLQEYLIAWGWAPWTDLLRVDVLNTIGVSMVLLALACWMATTLSRSAYARVSTALTATAMGLAITLVTPPLWTTWAPAWLPWPIESYINGVHNLGQPQAWLFPIFPWAGFAFAGLAVGSGLQTGWAKKMGGSVFALAAGGGILLLLIARGLHASSGSFYRTSDYWHTSPAFFLARTGILLVVLAAGYGWCQWSRRGWGFSPLVQLGQTSLLVYWIHLEFVYGRLSILPKKATDIQSASVGLLTIFLAMLLVALLRTRLKDRKANVPQPEPRNLGFKTPTIAR
jgi:uncharacterized membrane protein